jgi:maltose/moltooligosaccharide transporter
LSPKYGRRKPYFTGVILASVTLFFMPHSPVFYWIVDLDSFYKYFHGAFRAFAADKLPESQRVQQDFATQSFLSVSVLRLL